MNRLEEIFRSNGKREDTHIDLLRICLETLWAALTDACPDLDEFSYIAAQIPDHFTNGVAALVNKLLREKLRDSFRPIEARVRQLAEMVERMQSDHAQQIQELQSNFTAQLVASERMVKIMFDDAVANMEQRHSAAMGSLAESHQAALREISAMIGALPVPQVSVSVPADSIRVETAVPAHAV